MVRDIAGMENLQSVHWREVWYEDKKDLFSEQEAHSSVLLTSPSLHKYLAVVPGWGSAEKEIEIFNKELDLFKEKYYKLKWEFDSKIEELKELNNEEFRISISYFSDLDKYKNSSEYEYSGNRKKSYYIINNIDSYKSRERIYNELVINGINEDVNIKEVIENYIKELVK
jgi:hypothetical protein